MLRCTYWDDPRCPHLNISVQLRQLAGLRRCRLMLRHHRKEENQIRNYFQFVRDLFLCLFLSPNLSIVHVPHSGSRSWFRVPLARAEFKRFVNI